MLSQSIISAIYHKPQRIDASSWWGDLPEKAPHSAWDTLSGFPNLALLVLLLPHWLLLLCSLPWILSASLSVNVQVPRLCLWTSLYLHPLPGRSQTDWGLWQPLRTPKFLSASWRQTHMPTWTSSLGISKFKCNFTIFSPLNKLTN